MKTVAALSSALFRFCALDVVACSNLTFTCTFTWMGERMDSCVCVFTWVRVHWCIHAYMYTSMRECLRMCHLRLCLYVCIFVSRHACVCVYIYIYTIRISAAQYIYKIHIYAFLLHSGAVFHSSGTFILRSTDGYLAFVYLNMIYTAHFVFTFITALLDPVSCCTWTGNSVHHTAAAYRPTLYTRDVATSVSLLLATIQWT